MPDLVAQSAIVWDRRPDIDLRWEVSAAPTGKMWDAMRSTQIGMADLGEDEAVRELESLGTELTGQPAALLVPTVTLGTILSVLSGAPRGSTVLMERRSHISWVEQGHVAAVSGATTLLLEGDELGAIPPSSIESALHQEYYGHRIPASLLCLENTHNICGGTILSPEYTQEVADLCHGYGIKVYLDGARVFNAAVALDVPLHRLTEPVDFAVIGLNKGLAAPFGALLCGSEEFIAEARSNGRRLGGLSMHKAGIYASAALVGLRTMVTRLKDDHTRARALAENISQVPGLSVNRKTVQTNLVRVDTKSSGHTAHEVAAGLAAHGIAVHVFERHAFKFAVHLEISDDDIARTSHVLHDVMTELTRNWRREG